MLIDNSSGKTIRILIVDDDTSFLQTIKHLLKKVEKNIIIVTTKSVDEALQILSDKNTYDIIISDYGMQIKNLDFLRELREKLFKTPFMLLTGKGREEIPIQALKLGANGYINKQGEPETVYSELEYIIRSVVEQKKASEQLENNEKKFRAVYESTAAFWQAADGTLLDVNNPALEMLGLSREEFLSCNSPNKRWNLFGEDGSKLRRHEHPSLVALKTGKTVSNFVMGVFNPKKDRNIWLSVNAIPQFRNTQKKPYQVLVTLHDLTKSKEIEIELESKHEVLDRVAESIDSGLAIISKDYSVVWVNTILKNAGFQSKQKCYQAIKRNNICPDCGVRKIFEENRSFDIHEYQTVNSKGETQYIELRAKPLKDKEGNIIGAIELAVPINERKKVEEALKRNKKELTLIIDSSPSIIFFKDLNGRFLQANKAFAKAINTTVENLIGKTVFDIYPSKIAEAMTEDDKIVFQTKKPILNIVEPYVSPTGVRWIRTHKIPTLDEKGEITGLIGFSEEITEQKKAEEALSESEAKFRNLVDKLPEMVFEIDIKGHVVFANSTALNTLGYTKDELENDFDANRFVAPDYLELSRKNMRIMFEGGMRTSNDYVFIKKDGTRVPVLLTSSAIIKDNKIVGARGIVVNLTERKKMEKQLEEKERLAAIGATARMVGHDIRNPLQSMIGEIYLLRTDLEKMPNSDLKKNIEESFDSIEQNILYTNKIVADLQDYSKALNPECKPFKLSDILVSVFDSVYTPDSIRITLNIDKCTVINSDPELVRRVLTNLVTNAIQAMPNGGRLEISGLEKDRYVQITVSDTGVGISEEARSKLFTPMFTTKAKGQGLGLAVVKRLIEALGGKVSFESQEGKGTKFIIELPIDNVH